MLVKITGKRNEEVLVTTSRKIAETFGKRHADVLRDIEKLECSQEFTERNYALSEYKDISGKNNKEYILTKDGFVMLAMGYNGEKAMQFKELYIKTFNEMETELKRIAEERKQWEIERAKGVLVRHILTDTIKMKVTDSPHKRFMYPNYTKLIYKILFGKTFSELKTEYGIKPKESLRDYITSEQLKEVEQMEMLVSSLINVGWGYGQIKGFIEQNHLKQIAG